jgi:hypothetical protein
MNSSSPPAPPSSTTDETPSPATTSTSETPPPATTFTHAQLVDTYTKALNYREGVQIEFDTLKKELSTLKELLMAGDEEEEGEDQKALPEVKATETFFTLFGIAFILVRLHSQKILNKVSTIKFNNYFQYFKKLIEMYSYMLILGATIKYPVGKASGTESNPPIPGAGMVSPPPPPESGMAPPPYPEAKQVVDQRLSGTMVGGKDPVPDEGGKQGEGYLDDTAFLYSLKAFHAFLFMNIASNVALKDIIETPFGLKYETTEWLEAFTKTENAIFGTREFIDIQETLFERCVYEFMMMFAQFELVVNMRSSSLQGNEALLKAFNEAILNFNTLENKPILTCKTEPCERPVSDLVGIAKEQIAQLTTLAEKGLVKSDSQQVMNTVKKLADNAHVIQIDIVKELSSTKPKGILGQIKNALTFSTKKPDAKQSQDMKQVADDIYKLGGDIYKGATTWKGIFENVKKTVPTAQGIDPVIKDLNTLTTELGEKGSFHVMLATLQTTLNLPLKEIPEIKVPQKDLEDLKKQMTALVPMLQATRSDAASQANVKTAVAALVQKIGVISKLLPTVVTPSAGMTQVSGTTPPPSQSIQEVAIVPPPDEDPMTAESTEQVDIVSPPAEGQATDIPKKVGGRKLRCSKKKTSRKKSKKTLRRSRCT